MKKDNRGRPKIYESGRPVTIYLDGGNWDLFRRIYGRDYSRMATLLIKHHVEKCLEQRVPKTE